MATKPHHPPIPGIIRPPFSTQPGYIFGSLAVAGFGTRDFYVATIPCRQAREMVVANHYSRRIVNNSYVHLGVFVGGELLGVLQFGYAMNPLHVGKVVANTGVDEHLELNRMWLDDKAPRNSGCLGVVYQASNFLFLGSHRTTFYELDGETYHPMLLTAHKKMGARGRYLREHRARATARSLRQFRYLFFVKPAFKRDLRMRPQPYPKPPAGPVGGAV